MHRTQNEVHKIIIITTMNGCRCWRREIFRIGSYCCCCCCMMMFCVLVDVEYEMLRAKKKKTKTKHESDSERECTQCRSKRSKNKKQNAERSTIVYSVWTQKSYLTNITTNNCSMLKRWKYNTFNCFYCPKGAKKPFKLEKPFVLKNEKKKKNNKILKWSNVPMQLAKMKQNTLFFFWRRL